MPSGGCDVPTARERLRRIDIRTIDERELDNKVRWGVETLLSRLDSTASDSVLTGRAGSGKTACVVEIMEGLTARGLPGLVFRLDRVPSVSTTADLGHYLGLEESPVLVLAAAAEVTGRPAVLIVDQLDAVSTVSGRSSDAFDLVEQLLHEARGMRGRVVIHTVVVCRAFDWQNDSRLRQLMPPDSQAQVEVAEFTVDDFRAILTDAGFDPALFLPRQLELLRLPQNLSLFLEAGFDGSRTPVFGTASSSTGVVWSRIGWTQEKSDSSVWRWPISTSTIATRRFAPQFCLNRTPTVAVNGRSGFGTSCSGPNTTRAAASSISFCDSWTTARSTMHADRLR